MKWTLIVALLAVDASAAAKGRCKDMDRETLAQRVQATSESAAQMIRDQTTEVDQYPTPFFTSAAIYRIVYYGGSNPVVFPVGCADPDFSTGLTLNAEGFFALSRKGGLQLDTPSLRLNYVRTFLDTTRMTTERLQFLRSFDEITLKNKPREAETRRFNALREKYTPAIKPPEATSHKPWRVTLFAVKGQDLVEIDANVMADGRVEAAIKTLEHDLPIAVVK